MHVTSTTPFAAAATSALAGAQKDRRRPAIETPEAIVEGDLVELTGTAPVARYRRLHVRGDGNRAQMILRLAGAMRRIHDESL